LAERVANLNWADRLTGEESTAINQLRDLVGRDRALANQVADMPFFTNSIEQHDINALSSLKKLMANYPEDLSILTEQDWFLDGLSDVEAIFVTVLARHSDLRTLEIFGKDDFKILATGDFVDDTKSDSIAMPLAGTVELISFNLPKFFASEFLSLVTDAIQIQEEFIGVAFPVKEIPALFTPPPETKTTDTVIVGFYVGTHIIVEPSLGIGDAKRIVTHELAHYYLSGSAYQGPPPWFSEGGPDFLASYVMARISGDSLEERKRDLATFINSPVSVCNRDYGIKNIQKLLDLIETDGYYGHRDQPYYYCNYKLGESFLLSLYETMGHDPFTAAFKEIYQLSTTESRRITEEEIYRSFLDNTPAGRVVDFKALYDSRHGGKFPVGG